MSRFLAVLLFFVAASAQAALVDRGGGLIYDNVLDITWLQDANYAKTSGYVSNGPMSWDEATIWADGLIYYDSVRDLWYDDWRLPATLQPDASCAEQFDAGGGFPLQGYDYGCTGSAMGHLSNVDGIRTESPGLFSNVQYISYWSGTEFAPSALNEDAWGFDFYDGYQGVDSKGGDRNAWAVRTGDVAVVPVPAAVWLFGSALGLLGRLCRNNVTDR